MIRYFTDIGSAFLFFTLSGANCKGVNFKIKGSGGILCVHHKETIKMFEFKYLKSCFHEPNYILHLYKPYPIDKRHRR